MSTATARPALLTAEEFGRRPDPGYPEELVRGRIVRMPPPNIRHGQVCMRAARVLDRFIEENDLGHLLINDAGVITERDPDSVRGPDLSFYSYQRLPKGDLPPTYAATAPELVVEVRSPGNAWKDLHRKIVEFLDAGVVCVVVLDPEAQRAFVFGHDQPRTLGLDDELTFPEILPGFAVEVRRFFS